eukprot:scaffold32335_cov119-Isochrysis_galbana.AAC.4
MCAGGRRCTDANADDAVHATRCALRAAAADRSTRQQAQATETDIRQEQHIGLVVRQVTVTGAIRRQKAAARCWW